MFKCTECEKEFIIKPQYCDCGNDLFEEIITIQTTSKKTHKRGLSYIKERLERKNINISSLMLFFSSIVLSGIILFSSIGIEKQENNTKKEH